MVNTVIIGAGDIARKRHIPALLRSQYGRLTGICNRHAETTREMAAQYGVRAYESPQAVFADPSVQAVLISTPPMSHAALAEQALEAGKYVLLEKPMSMTLADAERICQAARKSGAALMLLHIQRFYDPHRKAKGLLEQGVIGKLLTCRSFLCEGYEALLTGVLQPAWMDTLYNMAVHRLDLVRWMTGLEAEEVFCHRSHLLTPQAAGGNDDHSVSLVRYAGGVLGTFIASETSYHGEDRSTLLLGTDGTIMTYAEGHDVVVRRRNGERIVYDFPTAHAQDSYELTDVHERFFRCILERRPMEVMAWDGLVSMRTLAALEQSDQTGRWVRVQQ